MRALLSVADKAGLVDLARGLVDLGYEIVSTGGTASELALHGVRTTAVSAVTGFPEILDGRVKTLHPAIHAGLLARRDDPAHEAELTERNIVPIDLVAVNLYPFAATVAQPGVALNEAVEQIDVGGPAMLRAAAKNFAAVVVLTDPADYASVLIELARGGPDQVTRRALAARAFAHVAAYDALIADFLRGDDPSFPPELALAGLRTRELRYGENPHQRAAGYRRLTAGAPRRGVLDAVQLAGKELSFNNILDADAAWRLLAEWQEPTVAIVKHTIPCGLAVRDRLVDAFEAALAGDPVSAYGGIVALNRPVDGVTAERMAKTFFEVVVAPDFEPEARDALARRRGLRLLAMPAQPADDARPVVWDVRPIVGGMLVQEADEGNEDPNHWRVVTARAPTEREWIDLHFAWTAVRRVASNAIVLVREQAVVGVGSGQPNRLGSVRIAVGTAGQRTVGAALASDAFFPFADGVEASSAAGVTAIVQPGGSIRDGEVIAAADAANVAMVFTGRRHFHH